VTVITRVLADAEGPAFGNPTKFIGPVYDEQRAHLLAAERGWVVKPDGDDWRRVVPSPDPKQIIQLGAIRRLVDGGFLVVCVGGGGVPVIAVDGGHAGVEAVIEKDLASALLAAGLGADVLVLATDVDAVYTGWGTPAQRAVRRAASAWLRGQAFAGGSMGPRSRPSAASSRRPEDAPRSGSSMRSRSCSPGQRAPRSTAGRRTSSSARERNLRRTRMARRLDPSPPGGHT
jgi:carbamate kinase